MRAQVEGVHAIAIELYTDRVQERDLDNFLVEELQASLPFRAWFRSRLPSSFKPPAGEVRVRKSPPRSDGRQTDVELGWFDEGNALVSCVLIESKVTADFQPGQAEAYRAEVENYRATLGDGCVCSILVAPTTRLATLAGRDAFDVALPLEEMAEVLRERILSEPDLSIEVAARLRVRSGLLDALSGKRQGSGWVPVTIEAKRDFAERYVELAALIVPRLKVRTSTDGPKALTRTFDGLDVPADFPCSVALRHEFGSGAGLKYANLLFSGAALKAADLKAQNGLLGAIGAHALEAGKSLAVRLPTPALVPEGDRFEEQQEKVRAGLEAVEVLADWFSANRGELAALLRAAEPASTSSSTQAPHSGKLQADLELAMRALAREAEDEFGYRPSYFLDLLDHYGAEGTIHHLLAGKPSSGFVRLWELKALHLSVEALIGREPWASSGMFDEIELRCARQRLKQVGYVEG